MDNVTPFESVAQIKNRIEQLKNHQPTPEQLKIIKQREEEEKCKELIAAREREEIRLDYMRIPKRYRGLSLDHYPVASAEQKKVVAFLREYADRPLDEMENLIIRGPLGTGKTHMICAFIQWYRKEKAQYWKLSDIMRTVRDGYYPYRDEKETELRFIERLATVPILVIDEIGRQTGSQFEGGFIFDVVDGRYGNLLPTIIVSNLPVDAEEGEPSMTSYLGISVMNRINENSLDISCNWGNYRDHAEIVIRTRVDSGGV
jgi:DNA replication protein DnaC